MRCSANGLLVQVEFRVRSVCPSVGNDRVVWKNGRPDRDAVCGGALDGSLSPTEMGKLLGIGGTALSQITLAFLLFSMLMVTVLYTMQNY